MEITSVNNELVKNTVKLQQKKYRDETKTFLLEGFKSVQEAYNYGVELEQVFVLKEKRGKYSFIKQELIETNEIVLKKISTTDSSPEVVAVAKQPEQKLDITKLNKIVLLENISDAGNLGTIIRSAVAFNIDAIILYGNTVDIYNTKCIRSTVGNLWKIKIIHLKAIKELTEKFNNYDIVATLPKTKNSVWFKNWTPKEKTIMMFGSEADGLSKELQQIATTNLTIEMNDKVESLNLSVSASIIMHKMGF